MFLFMQKKIPSTKQLFLLTLLWLDGEHVMITSTTDPRYDQKDDRPLHQESSIQAPHEISPSDNLVFSASESIPIHEGNRNTVSQTLSTSLLDRIPASSYLSKRIQTQHDSLSESRKVAIARPLSANSALAFISDQGHTGKLKDPPKSLKRGETSTAKIDAIPSSPRRNVCLTHPGEPVHNHGYDNVDGNLIVHEHDVIKPQSYCNMVIKGQELVKRLEARDSPSFRVLNLLGQGTFAHVFKCENVRTKDHVAVKIIKNKPAYTNQALIEIDIFLRLNRSSVDATNSTMRGKSKRTQDPFVNLLCYFMYRSHLCLVFELLGMNLYEILKRRQFRGLPLNVVRDFMRQALDGMNIMASQNIIHCDLKPENILIVTENTLNDIHMMEEAPRISNLSPKIKLIDFGSACFEGQLGHAYIQSRFYRSPEVLLGLDYDSAIDVWSLGCVAAELLLGLPILPGLNEHDQLTRICEMIGEIPEWMIENGTKASNHFAWRDYGNIITHNDQVGWRLKTPDEFCASFGEDERKKMSVGKGTHRYFKRKILEDIISFHGCVQSSDEKVSLPSFIHLLKGMLEIDPWNRLTAYQASKHPFFGGHVPGHSLASYNNLESEGSFSMTVFWKPPWDPLVTRRKLLMRQKGHRSQSYSTPLQAKSVTSSSTIHNTISIMDGDDSSSRFSSQSNNALFTPLNKGSHPNLVALHRRSFGRYDSNIGPITSNPGLYHSIRSGVNGPPAFISTRYIPQEKEDIPVPNEDLPQSFSGSYYDQLHPVVPGDLGLALQRPGVIPTRGDLLASPNHHFIPHHIPVNALIRSNSFASFHSEYNNWNLPNINLDNHPSSYSDVYLGINHANPSSYDSPLLSMHPMPLYQQIMEHSHNQRMPNNTNSLLAQQLFEYSKLHSSPDE